MLEGMALGVLFLLVYITGLNTGLRLAKSGMKEEIKIANPVEKVVKTVKDMKENKELEERNKFIQKGIENIFGFDGTPQERE